jgi:16S rRNA (guanine966-N2)-methyltransferase
MRIVAGRFRGRSLATPRTNAIRPTADRLRESMFNILIHGFDDPVSDARVLDLFAGTGALGLEALSRGAASGVFVDDGTEARALLRENILDFGLAGLTKILRRDATCLGSAAPIAPSSLVFCDPPYRKELGEKALASAAGGGWLSKGAIVVWEEAADTAITIPTNFTVLDQRRQGEGMAYFLRYL